jgi:hypothetical protein
VTTLTATMSPSLLNEFVFSYGSNHLHLFNTGSAWKRPASMTMTGIFENGLTERFHRFVLAGTETSISSVDPGYLPWNNSNPTYSFHDNLTWIRGKHNFTIGTYFEAIEKNEPAQEEPNGSLIFSTGMQIPPTVKSATRRTVFEHGQWLSRICSWDTSMVSRNRTRT